MSYTYEDAAYDMYMDEEGAKLLYEEHREQALSEFAAERLQSYYLGHPALAEPVLRALAASRDLLVKHPCAALIFAASAVEIGIKGVLLRPVVYGLVHQESTAALITDLATSHTSFGRFRELLLQILAEHGGTDLRTVKRHGATKPLWEEDQVDPEHAELGVQVASTVVETLIPTVLQRLGLHLHGGMRVCGEPGCRAALQPSGATPSK